MLGDSNTLLALEVRSYPDLRQECELRGNCETGYVATEVNYNCWVTSLVCTDGPTPTCVNSYFETYSTCTRSTVSGTEIVRCEISHAGEGSWCVIAHPNALRPQEEPQFAPCFDPARFADCPVNGDCVPCEQRAYDHSNC